jgi:phospholipase/lecithinase/hemolysin
VNVAVQTLLAANTELDVVVANLPDLRSIPGLRQAIASTPGLEVFAAGVDQAVQGYNAQIKALADGSGRVAMVDAYAISKVPLEATPIPFDGIVLDPIIPDNGATHYFVDVIHPGTVASGILANAFVDASNAEFGSGIQRFTDREIVALAIPLPAPALVGVAGLVMAAGAVVRQRRAA